MLLRLSALSISFKTSPLRLMFWRAALVLENWSQIFRRTSASKAKDGEKKRKKEKRLNDGKITVVSYALQTPPLVAHAKLSGPKFIFCKGDIKYSQKKTIFGHFFYFLRPASGHGSLNHP